ncbi:MAG: bifunctional 4-hydroxy-3-methylbut-2-enyl diphosphate reductase/30S ribosomal protein S1 [Oscillospiraceae bacterium]|jgi:4-hydroxy-3-methylbut-2-enyl diphosphate reductase|nr:bifunctional 4-hydroxy-3-methylbut-2-enyl diphosphate reductase/30S ribosomal protein S1 [Oscillospiraceae bacterium]
MIILVAKNQSADRINTTKTIGLCFGVRRAIDIILKLVGEGKKVTTLGSIAHNSFLKKELFQKNVKIISSIDELESGTTLVVRAHGIELKTLERIKSLGISYEDATCPFVTKIHNIVANAANNSVILIAGDKFHAEVVGTIGHCKSRNFVFRNYKELKDLLSKIDLNSKIVVVSQTTFSLTEWQMCVNFLKRFFKEAKIFNTICTETQKRQRETQEISQKSDTMFVVGDSSSSNTLKLKNISSKYCKTYLIESAQQINRNCVIKSKKIGITAGASTPNNIIEEVLRKMAKILDDEAENEKNNLQEKNGEQTFGEMLEESLREFGNSSKYVRATVDKITPNEIYVNMGGKQTGIVPLSELTSDQKLKPEDVVSVGEELDLLILKVNEQEGVTILSKKRLDKNKGFTAMTEALEKKITLKGVVTEIVKGGLIVPLDEINVFIPNSQATTSRDDVLEDLLQKEISFKIIEVDAAKNKIVGSVKSILREKRKKMQEKFWKTAEVGKKYKGEVKTLKEYGAFVDIGGIDGMLHISEISWVRIGHPSEVLKVGDEIEVYIKSLDHDTKKISLGYKKDEDNPWEKIKKDYKEGDVAEVTIVGFTDFGAFARVIEGVDGLIHISQIADYRVETPQDVLEIGQVVKVVIREIDFENKRLSLSIKEASKIEDDQ